MAMAMALALVAAIAALQITAGGAFVEVGTDCVDVPTVRTYDAAQDATGSASTDEEAVDAPAAVVELPSCTSEVVEVENSDESVRASLDLSSKGIQVVESVPSVAILDLSNNSVSTLQGFGAPSELRVLNLYLNAFESLQNASIPDTVEVLNLSANPFESLTDLEFPDALTELIVADGSLTALENFTFAGTITSLNFSTNPITRVAGVTFPKSLERLTLLSAKDNNNVLQEFEVRETDATLFASLQTWDVSSTTVFTCSDSRANLRYVQNTLLCVLDDDVFEAKYADARSSSSRSSNGNSETAIKQKLKETMQQPRTWFLILGSVLLCAITVMMLGIAMLHWRRQRLQEEERDEWRRQTDELSYKQLLREAETPRRNQTPRRIPEFV